LRENNQNCPQDCLPSQEDEYCDGLEDGVCDPDCTSQADPDCEPEEAGLLENVVYQTFRKPIAEFQGMRKPMQRAYFVIIAGIFVTVVSALSLFTVLTRMAILNILKKPSFERKREKIVKKLKEEIELSPESQKHYDRHKWIIQDYLKKGFNKDQIKAELLKLNLSEHLIDEILKKF